MLKREELSNPASCLNRAADDEPIFVLRANDTVAAPIVRAWASRYLEAKIAAQEGQLTDKQTRKYAEAWELATAMELWKNRHPSDVKETL